MARKKTSPEAPQTQEQPALRLEYTALSELKRAPRNPKLHSLDEIGKSFNRFGFVNPIVVDDSTGQLIAGHGRADELELLKATGQPAPTRIQVREDGEWLVPVIRGVAFEDPKEAEAYLMSDNRLVELGGWDDAGVSKILADLAAGAEDGVDPLAGTGYSTADLARLDAELTPLMDDLSEKGGLTKHSSEDPEVDQPEKGKYPPHTLAPFPYFGGKSSLAAEVWKRLGTPKQYIEPFCGSAAVLLTAPKPASLEVVCDASGFIANFWRAVKHQSQEVAHWADYPVSHIDLGARHKWLLEQRERLAGELQDPDWTGDPKVAGWWLWGQCCWIGSGWCEWDSGHGESSQIPHVSDAGQGIQAIGQVAHTGNAGMGVQAIGQIPHLTSPDHGMLSAESAPENPEEGFLTSSGQVASVWLRKMAQRLERVRVGHGDWSRFLNHHYGGDDTAVFLDPPYRAYEKLYGGSVTPVADEVVTWARENAHLKIALCGHVGDYDLPGWDAVPWSRGRLTYSGKQTTNKECVWYSPACLPKST